jgi:K+/H+ antiporter YhaU regulatory subunit KhtT
MIFSIAFLLVVVTMSLLVTRIASVALVLTGMSMESARFQARSALAGVGYTTSEAELVVNHPVRRRIIMLLMLIGNIGVPTVVATLVVSLLTATQTENWWVPLLLLILGLGTLLYLAKSKWLEVHLNRVLARILKRWTDLEVRDYISLLQLQNGYAVSEMLVEPGDWIENRSLADAALSHEGILVLGIQRKDGAFVGAPRALDTVQAGDVLVLYGEGRRLEELDARTSGTGDDAHRQAVAELGPPPPTAT